jgi:hypothetical protein
VGLVDLDKDKDKESITNHSFLTAGLVHVVRSSTGAATAAVALASSQIAEDRILLKSILRMRKLCRQR